MKSAIIVENLSKQYRIGSRGREEYRTLRESLIGAAVTPWRWVRALAGMNRDRIAPRKQTEEFWALKDVSFVVEPGEVVGIIGRNGAGKSTLLKILSRITEPTGGRAEIRGRVGSLLEVGTGFHPELTGRENIYLNGSILGMSRREIGRKFDAIVAFSEIEKFLDTPVKRYSSGMYVRLAFAVAAHLDPEILIVDEVLAVGDATYQKRCIDRMADLAASGQTVLFVSHNMDVIPRLCRKAITLDSGRVHDAGSARSVVERYLSEQLENLHDENLTDRARYGDGRARFIKIQLIGPDTNARCYHVSGEDLVVRVSIESTMDIDEADLAINIKTMSGGRIISGWAKEAGFRVVLKSGIQYYQCRFRNVWLRPTHRISIGLWMESAGVIDYIEDAKTFEVIDGPDTNRFSTNEYQGILLCNYLWSCD